MLAADLRTSAHPRATSAWPDGRLTHAQRYGRDVVAEELTQHAVVFTVPDYVNYGNVVSVKHTALDLIERGVRTLILDFGRTGWIDSNGLGAFVAIQNRMRERDGWLIIAGLAFEPLQTFRLAGIDELFTIEKSALHALVESQATTWERYPAAPAGGR